MNNKVSSLQVTMILALLCSSMFLGLSDIILLRLSYNDTLIAMILGVFIGLIPILLYLKINNCYPQLDIYKKNIKLFGKAFGMILNILYVLACFILLIISIRTLVIFVSSKYLEQTPYYAIGLLVIITLLVISSGKLETVARVSQILFFFTILLVFFIEILLIDYVEIDNIFPMLTGNYLKKIIDGALFFASSVSIPVILLLSISKNEISDNKKYSKYIILFYLIAAISLIFVMFFIISCFGYNLSSMFRYPEYVLLKKIIVSNTDLHIENILAFRWLFYATTLGNMCIYSINKGLNNIKIKNKSRTLILSLIALLAMYLSRNLFKNITSSIILFKNHYFTFVALPIFLILIIIFIRTLTIKKNDRV